MTSRANEDIRTRVFRQVRLCMENLAGGSGHMGCYHLSEGTFQIEETRDLGDGLTEYLFSVAGWLEDEFTVPEPPQIDIIPDREGDDSDVGFAPPSGPDSLLPPLPSFEYRDNETLFRGSLVLDSGFRIILDSQGRVRIHPWKTIDPEFWMPDE